MDLALLFIISFLLSVLFHPVAIWISKNLKLFDNPYRDRIHVEPTPVLGGVAICLSVLLTMVGATLVDAYQWDRVAEGLLVGGVLIALIGFIDDRFGMNPSIKLVGQIIAGGMFVIFTEAGLGIFHPAIEFGALIFLLVVMMNAFNILDNMDGVTGTMSFVSATAFLAVAILTRDHNMAILAAVLSGAVVGFLRFNLPRARIFMGDSGAMFLGFMLGAFAIIYIMNNKSYYLLTTPFLILSYPIFDIALVSLARIREKRSLAVAAPDSSSYRLAKWIFTTNNAFVAILVINLVLGLFGIATYVLKENQLSVLLIFIAGLALAVLGVHLYRNFLFFFERTFFFIVDMASINLAFYMLYAFKYSWGIFSYEVYIPYSEMLAPAIWISLFWVLLFSVMGIYEIRPDRRFRDYLRALIKVVGFGVIFFVFIVIFLEGNIVVSILPLLLYATILIVVNGVFKYLAFVLIRSLFSRRGKQPAAALFIKDIDADIEKLLDSAREKFQISGYVCSKDLGGRLSDLKYLGDEQNLNQIIKYRRLEKIILVWSDNDFADYMPILSSYFYLENQFLIHDPKSVPFAGFRKIKLYGTGFVRLSTELLRTWEWAVKRGVDIFISLIVLILTSPIFVFQYIMAKFKRRPFLVKVGFYGRDGRASYCHDFYRHAQRNQSTDIVQPALPALLNVLTGSLTLVGTLPLTLAKAMKDNVSVPGFWRRRLIKPGIFGLPHFSAPDLYFEKELKYMENMSILFDSYLIITGILCKLINLPRKIENAGPEIYQR
jgi:UDP-GlcNAc:undecaprenyl-phosphate GlcNAc-1-phosphate transferase